MFFNKNFRRNTLALLIAIVSLFYRPSGRAASLNFGWVPSPSACTLGYRVYYGTTNGVYSESIDSGINTNVAITDLQPGHTYYFAVVAYNEDDMESPFSNQIIYSIPALPVITTQPVSQTAVAGATINFSIGITSVASWACQWYIGTKPTYIANRTNLSLTNITDANAGNYSVVVYNAGGSVTSSVVSLSVIDRPVITVQPVGLSVAYGGGAVLSVSVTGTAPFVFQWYCNGAAVAAGNKASLHLANLTAANAGNYYVQVQNAAGTVASASVAVSVNVNYTALAGAYNGLFYQTNATTVPLVTEQTAGMLGNLILGTNGTYSAKLYAAGQSYSIAGMLNNSGSDVEVVSRDATGASNLTVSLQLDVSGATQMITGLVSNMDQMNPWIVPLVADLATNALPVPLGSMAFTIPPVLGSPNSPAGFGSALITVIGDTATVVGALYDATPISESVPIAKDGTIPLYFNLYNNTGVLEGWVNLAGGSVNGLVTWVRPAGIITAMPFPLGFTNVVTIGSGLVVDL